MGVSCPGGQLTRGQFAAVSCPCSPCGYCDIAHELRDLDSLETLMTT